MSTGEEGMTPTPMEEEKVPPESPDSIPDSGASMDWVKIDETITKESSHEDAYPITQSEKMHPVPSNTNNFDEYSFGSSDDDNEEEEQELEKMAYVSLDSSFDMSILQDSIEKSEDALSLVEGKDVVMIVGKTGVGKSTLIQGIAGKTIHTSVHKSTFSGQTATKTVFDAQDPLGNFEIGHGKVSKTRSLNAYLRKSGDNEVVYLDSPGLEDTRGAEMDIATAVLLSQVAKRCKSLRFVILIHCASLLEDRGNAFRSVLQFSNRFVKDFSDEKRSFMFLFTHSHEVTSMSNISDAKKRLQEEIVQIAASTKGDDILAVLDFVRKSLKKEYPFAGVLLPLGTNYQSLADTIEQKINSVSDLQSASNCNLTLSSEMKLRVAVQTLLERLQLAINTFPRNAMQAKDIKQSIQYLHKYIDTESVDDAARQCDEVINRHKEDLNACIDSEFARWENSTGKNM